MKPSLRRIIEDDIRAYFNTEDAPILLIDGARQVGKSYIIRKLGMEHYNNYVEINMVEDKENYGVFKNIRSTKEMYLAIQSVAGKN